MTYSSAQSRYAAAALIIVIAAVASTCLFFSLPVVAFKQDGSCAYVQYEATKEACTPDIMPEKYNKITVSNQWGKKHE